MMIGGIATSKACKEWRARAERAEAACAAMREALQESSRAWGRLAADYAWATAEKRAALGARAIEALREQHVVAGPLPPEDAAIITEWDALMGGVPRRK